MSMKVKLGTIVHDWPRFLRAMRAPRFWVEMRNRNERLTLDGRGARCEWVFTSDLHLAKVYPFAGAWLMRRALRDWPIELSDAPPRKERPDVSFIVGHRGLDRLPHLVATLRSIAGQKDARIECIVVEQSQKSEVAAALPSWVRHLHTPSSDPYNRSWAFNAGAQLARGSVLILHDNDMLCPARYAAETLERVREGWSFLELKRFLFYFDEAVSREVFETGTIPSRAPENVLQNAQGGSIAATREAFEAIGGFDQSFVGWGGEDNEFWERAETTGRVYTFGYLPFIHLWHPPQPGKQDSQAPAVRRYRELKGIPPAERIARLRRGRGRDVE